MKRIFIVLPIVIAATTGCAERAQPVADVSPDMNGRYRCDGGATFDVHVKAAPVVTSGVEWQPAGVKSEKNYTASSGGYQSVNRDRITGTDFYGARIEFSGKAFDLQRKDGAAIEMADKDGELRWLVGEVKTPFTGKLYRHNELLGGNCRLVEPESKNEQKK